MIKHAKRIKDVQFVVVDGSLECLYDLREMLPYSGPDVNEGDITRGKKPEDGTKGEFLACSKYTVGSNSVPVGSIVFKLVTKVEVEEVMGKKTIQNEDGKNVVVDYVKVPFEKEEYDWYCVPEGDFFKKYKEIKETK